MNIGKIKSILDRQRVYASWGQFFMIVYIFIKSQGWQWWYLLVIPGWVLWAWIDTKYILPSERSYLDSKSNILKEIKNGR